MNLTFLLESVKAYLNSSDSLTIHWTYTTSFDETSHVLEAYMPLFAIGLLLGLVATLRLVASKDSPSSTYRHFKRSYSYRPRKKYVKDVGTQHGDWECAYCGGMNPPVERMCIHCSAKKTKGVE